MTTRTKAQPTRSHTVTESPIGPLTLVAADGALIGVYMESARHQLTAEVTGPAAPQDPALMAAADQLRGYFAGELTDFTLPLAPEGSPFQRTVWSALRDIPYGETISYGQLANRIGQPSAFRAVGLANGANPISIVVPCHRVIGANGSLTGYGGGLDRKRFLLSLEQRVTGQTLA